MRALVLVNAHAGLLSRATSDPVSHVRDVLRQAGVGPEVRAVLPEQLTRAAEQAREFDAVIAAGGDGTVSSVARGLVGCDTPLGILPMGTMNNFARDIGLPLDPLQAARVIARGTCRLVDLGRVNDHIFINNSSIGLYPQMVLSRQRQQRLGRGKWLAMLLAGFAVIRRFPLLWVRIGVGGESLLRSTAFVFIGNNRYEIHLFSLGRRSRLDEGLLSLYLTREATRLTLLRLAALALANRLKEAQELETLELREFSIETMKKTLRVSLDGEVRELRPPLRYRVMPAALRVLA